MSPTTTLARFEARVLVAEPDAQLLHLISLVLHLEGFGVEAARIGQEATAQIDSSRLDLVLLDVELSGMESARWGGRRHLWDRAETALIRGLQLAPTRHLQGHGTSRSSKDEPTRPRQP